jgi:hypothetical protein
MMRGAGQAIGAVVLISVFLAIIGIAWFSLSRQIETMSTVVRVPQNGISCQGSTVTMKIRNMGNQPINNSEYLNILGLFENDPDIVARWSFDERWDNKTIDSSGNANHGSIYADTVLLMHLNEGSGNPLDSSSYANHGDITGHEPTWLSSINCKSGKCMDFDGVDDYVDTSYFPDPRRAKTIAFWIKFNNVANTQAIGAFDGTNRFYAGIDLNNNILVGIGDTFVGFGTNDVYSDINESEWTHYAVVSDGSSVDVYINAVRKHGFAFTATAASTYEFIIGSRYYTGTKTNAPINGSIDEVAIYNRSLTGPEVQEQYEAGRAKFIERERPGKFGYGMELDGADDYVEVPDDNSLDFAAGDDLTICSWFKTSASGVGQDIIDKRGATSIGYLFGVADTDVLSTFFKNSVGGVSGNILGTTIVTDGNWHIGCVVHDRNSHIQLYIDGSPDGSSAAPLSGDLSNNRNLFLGFRDPILVTSVWGHFDGTIDEVVIIRRALTQPEIQAQFKPSCSCAGQTCQCGDLQITKTSGSGDFQPFFDIDEIPNGGTATMYDYSCLSDSCSYRIVATGGVEEVITDCK